MFTDLIHRPGKDWTHEDASEMMFDDLIDKNCIDIDQHDVNFIKDLIKGVTNHSKHKYVLMFINVESFGGS